MFVVVHKDIGEGVIDRSNIGDCSNNRRLLGSRIKGGDHSTLFDANTDLPRPLTRKIVGKCANSQKFPSVRNHSKEKTLSTYEIYLVSKKERDKDK
jgi:hypothetical protein